MGGLHWFLLGESGTTLFTSEQKRSACSLRPVKRQSDQEGVNNTEACPPVIVCLCSLLSKKMILKEEMPLMWRMSNHRVESRFRLTYFLDVSLVGCISVFIFVCPDLHQGPDSLKSYTALVLVNCVQVSQNNIWSTKRVQKVKFSKNCAAEQKASVCQGFCI